MGEKAMILWRIPHRGRRRCTHTVQNALTENLVCQSLRQQRTEQIVLYYLHEPSRKVAFIGFLFLLYAGRRLGNRCVMRRKMEKFTEFLVAVDDLVWGIPLIVLIMGTGILFDRKIKRLGSSVQKAGKALKYMVKK